MRTSLMERNQALTKPLAAKTAEEREASEADSQQKPFIIFSSELFSCVEKKNPNT